MNALEPSLLLVAADDPVLQRIPHILDRLVKLIAQSADELTTASKDLSAQLAEYVPALEAVSEDEYYTTFLRHLMQGLAQLDGISIGTEGARRALSFASALQRIAEAVLAKLRTEQAVERAALALATEWAERKKAKVVRDWHAPGPEFGDGASRVLVVKTGVFNNFVWYVHQTGDHPPEIRRWLDPPESFWREVRHS